MSQIGLDKTGESVNDDTTFIFEITIMPSLRRS